MQDQPSLFPLDDYHQNPLNENISFYVEVDIEGITYFIWKPHTDYDQLTRLDQKGRKKPFRWLTSRGAVNYAARNYLNHKWTVKNFREEDWQ